MRHSQSELPTGTVTVVLGDVEGSTRAWAADREAMAAAMDHLDRLITETVEAHRGARPLEQGEGDSFVCAFARATDAVDFALALQRALIDGHPACSMRIAIHTGEVEVQSGRYTGHTMNRCARLRSLAHGGQTLLSCPTSELVADQLPQDLELIDLGTHELRDLARPEHVYQLSHPDLPRDFPHLASMRMRQHNLPPEVTSFVGRTSELAELFALVKEVRVLTLTGPGGCGKTRLAQRLAAAVTDEFADGVWWVDLAPISDPGLVPGAAASVLSIREAPAEDMKVTLARHLQERRMLLVLDNCEHVIDACAELTRASIRACPHLTVLTTSREPLGVAGETSWRVPSLPFPAAGEQPSLDALAGYDAIRLFVERAARVRPNFRLTADNAPGVAAVCSRLEGIPLAIELAAAQTRMLSPQQVAAELAESFRMLTGGERSALARQRTLEASIDWSYELLDADERTLLARLSVFAGGFTLDAAEAVCADEQIDTYRVLDVLGRLVDRSLVQVDEGACTRYRLLDTVRHFASRRLVESGDGPATRDRHLDFYLALAQTLEPALIGPGLSEAMERLRPENDNLRTAIDWGLQTRDADRCGHLIGALLDYWVADGRHAEGLGWAAAALELPFQAPLARFEALRAATSLASYTGDVERGIAWGEEGVAVARTLDHRRSVGQALQVLGFHYVYADRSAARATLEEGIAISREEEDYRYLADGLAVRGLLDVHLGNPDDARRVAEESVEVARRHGIRLDLPMGLFFLGWAMYLQGDLAAARATATEARVRAQEIADPFFATVALDLLGAVAMLQGDLDEAAGFLTETLETGRQAGNLWATALSLEHLGQLSYRRGDFEQAAPMLQEAIVLLSGVGLDFRAAHAQFTLGDIAEASGDREGAVEAWSKALKMATDGDDPLGAGRAKQRLARQMLWRDDHRGAEELVHDALTTYVGRGDRLGMVDAIEDLAVLAADHESWDEAARLLAAASGERQATGYVRPPIGLDAHQRLIEQLREQLGDEGFENAWSEGETMSMTAAVAYARKRRGSRKRPSTGWASLTPTELQVAELVARGLTNPGIAERLFITRGTVKVHLSHIFAKLGIANRTELATVAIRHGAHDGAFK